MKTSDTRRSLRFFIVTIITLSIVVLWLVSAQQLETASAGTRRQHLVPKL
jgi:hypothetical protein